MYQQINIDHAIMQWAVAIARAVTHENNSDNHAFL